MLKKIPSYVIVIFIAIFMLTCEPSEKNPLTTVLASSNPKISAIINNLEAHELQVRFTQIHRLNDSIYFKDYDFQVDKNQYFYPASTVKFPIAVLALEKLNETQNITRDTKFYIEGDTVETTFSKEISKIFAVSDNAAYNRLFEFLGANSINNRLLEKGISPVRIAHRLSVPDAADVTTLPLILYLNDSTTTSLSPSINTAPKTLRLKGITKGSGFYQGEVLMEKPFDFGLKNYYPIAAQHQVLKRVIFPQHFKLSERFNITKVQRDFLLNTMQTLPKNAGYLSDDYYDSYVKFFMFGDRKEAIPDHIKIFNKVGYAYGTLTDCAYILDTKNNIEFMVTASLLVNKNGVFNDNVYEYEEIGIPFLAQLGRELYEMEKQRKKKDHGKIKL